MKPNLRELLEDLRDYLDVLEAQRQTHIHDE